MLKVNNTVKRTFTKSGILSQGDKPNLGWDDFVQSLNSKNTSMNNQNKKPTNGNNRRNNNGNRNFNNNGRSSNGNKESNGNYNRKNFNGNNNQNRNYARNRDSNKPVRKEDAVKKELESIKLTGPDGAAKDSSEKKGSSTEIDLSLFDTVEAINSGSSRPSFKRNDNKSNRSNNKDGNRNNNRTGNRNFKPKEEKYNLSTEKMFEGHNFGIKKFKIATAEEQHTNRLPYYKLKNDAKVNIKTAVNFFKKNSVYEHDDAFLNPDLVFSHERDALMYTPRIISSKEHVLRDTSFEVFKSLSNEFNYKKEKTKTLLAMNNWTALPEGTDVNSPEYDYADRYMLHQEATRGSTFESVYLNAMRAVRTDSTLVADKMRVNSILAGKYNQDFLPESSVKSLSDFQKQYKGKFAPNVVKNIHKTSDILANALNFSPAFINDSSRKQEVFDYLTLNKSFGGILASKKEILKGHSPEKKAK